MTCKLAAGAFMALIVLGAPARAHHGHGGHMFGGGHDHMMDRHESAGAHWTAPEHAEAQANPFPVTREGLAYAAEIYEDNCAACHGADGKGGGPAAAGLNPKPADLQEMVPRHTDGGLAWKIARGRGAMPAWGEYFDRETIWRLVAYLRHVIAAGVVAAGSHGQETREHPH